MTILLLERLNVPLDRDVIFIAEAGEEGTSGVGIGFLVDQHWEAIAASIIYSLLPSNLCVTAPG